MGAISQIVKTDFAPTPPFNQRLCVELCENVHLHIRNLRLEFSPEEFVTLLETLGKVSFSELASFRFGPHEFKEVASAKLPSNCAHDHRIQIEKQVDGTYHFHYRSLRIETEQLEFIGL